jgi:hypothetical protein
MMFEQHMPDKLYSKFLFLIIDSYIEKFRNYFIKEFDNLPLEQRLQDDDSGNESHWDCYCYYVQYNVSFYVELYKDTIKQIICPYVDDLSQFEMAILKQHFDSLEDVEDISDYHQVSLSSAHLHKNSLIDFLVDYIESKANNHEIPNE